MAMTTAQRIGRIVTTSVLSVAVVAGVGSCTPMGDAGQAAQYCALMPDSVGLYVGNPVTQMGYAIGEIKSITPGNTAVRVDFEITEDRRFPQDVKAVTRSASILADRTLELVGNPGPGPALAAGECVPLSRSFTPKSLSQVISSTTDLIDSISPAGSVNVADAVRGLDEAIAGTGGGVNQLLIRSSAVLDNPDQTVAEIGSIINNLAQLTDFVRDQRDPIKQILFDMQTALPDILKVTESIPKNLFGTVILFKAAADIEVTLGEPLQATLDAMSVALRKTSAHAPRLANLLNPVPWWINTVANHYNSNRPFNTLGYRPPLYRIRTPNGVALCNVMNASAPGSCANVQGTPYAVDVALLQYVLTEAARR